MLKARASPFAFILPIPFLSKTAGQRSWAIRPWGREVTLYGHTRVRQRNGRFRGTRRLKSTVKCQATNANPLAVMAVVGVVLFI